MQLFVVSFLTILACVAADGPVRTAYDTAVAPINQAIRWGGQAANIPDRFLAGNGGGQNSLSYLSSQQTLPGGSNGWSGSYQLGGQQGGQFDGLTRQGTQQGPGGFLSGIFGAVPNLFGGLGQGSSSGMGQFVSGASDIGNGFLNAGLGTARSIASGIGQGFNGLQKMGGGLFNAGRGLTGSTFNAATQTGSSFPNGALGTVQNSASSLLSAPLDTARSLTNSAAQTVGQAVGGGASLQVV